MENYHSIVTWPFVVYIEMDTSAFLTEHELEKIPVYVSMFVTQLCTPMMKHIREMGDGSLTTAVSLQS